VTSQSAPPVTTDTLLGRSVLPIARAHPGTSGIVALQDGRDAFAARVLLAEAAEQTLDVQYYIWHADTTGMLLFDALRRAADRGVRVRLLLDDNNTGGLDTVLAALDQHPNIAVRLFNPFLHRRWRILDYVGDFGRINRRMHNKSFTADSHVTIIGGRNVGDEYFGAGHGLLFVDLDVLAIGPVVQDVSRDFDRYWNSQSAYPVHRLIHRVSSGSVAEVSAAASRMERSPEAVSYLQTLTESPLLHELLAGTLPFEWAATTMVSDDPGKALGRASDEQLLWSRLKSVLCVPTRQLELISPYFVPGAEGVGSLGALAKAGVRISVLTNSVEATDVAAVHAGYAKRRKALLQAGITLFEMKRDPSGGGEGGKRAGGSGSSRSSLHAKTFSVDRSRVFVGSFNFDPRSARLNTEMGLVIDSPALAQAIADTFAGPIAEREYRVELTDAGTLRWSEPTQGRVVVHRREPGLGIWRGLAVFIMSKLPVEWLL
jgi:putative cardiolipin synthase